MSACIVLCSNCHKKLHEKTGAARTFGTLVHSNRDLAAPNRQ
jgi:hypothetical protein